MIFNLAEEKAKRAPDLSEIVPHLSGTARCLSCNPVYSFSLPWELVVRGLLHQGLKRSPSTSHSESGRDSDSAELGKRKAQK